MAMILTTVSSNIFSTAIILIVMAIILNPLDAKLISAKLL